MFEWSFWQPVSSSFHIPTGFAHNSGHAGGLRGFSTDRETVYRNCLPMHDGKENMAARRSTHTKLWRLQRWFGKNKYDLSFLCPRVIWSTVRLTNWPSAIGICFVTTLHSLLVGWLQLQVAHNMTVSWLRAIMTRFWHEVTIITTSCYFTAILL